jgi:hypothetical protein
MSPKKLTRRAAIAIFTSCVLATFFARASSRAAGVHDTVRLHVRDIRVDVGPLVEQSGEPTASWVREALSAQLAKTFAARMAPADRGAATLAVRIDSVTLGAGGLDREDDAMDSMTGVVTVVGGVSFPMRATAVYAPIGDDDPDWRGATQRRIAALAESFVGWLSRESSL